jgi:hypothetical protein
VALDEPRYPVSIEVADRHRPEAMMIRLAGTIPRMTDVMEKASHLQLAICWMGELELGGSLKTVVEFRKVQTFIGRRRR